jgi:phosphoglycerate dehydrogenase-like enzyme
MSETLIYRRFKMRHVNVRSALAVACVLLPAVAAAASAAETVTVCVPESLAARLADLGKAHPSLRLVSAKEAPDLVRRAPECDALVGLYGEAVGEVVRAGSKLRWVQVGSAGVKGYVSVPELRDSDIVLTNFKIYQGPEIADHAFGLLLNLTRDIKFFGEQMSTGWKRSPRLPMIELRGRTALVIGLGGIGTQVAQRAAAFEMRVLAVDPKDMPLHRDVAYVGKPDELDRLLPEADVVFSCAPWTPETEGLLGPEQFELMKEGVYVVNVSRGAIVDTDALVAALRSGKAAGAGLDVTHPEPLPADHPLWKMPNVIITPHVAGRSDRSGERQRELFRDNIARFVEGQPLRNIVDKTRGY